MSIQILSMICRGLFVVLLPVLFLAAKTRADIVYVHVAQNGTSFSPNSVSIAPGDTVQWIWYGSPPYNTNHSVTSGTPANPTPDVFNSGIHVAPYVFEHTFATAGTFRYFCQVHTTMMTGTVVFAAAGPPGTLAIISTRLRVETADNVLIGGFIVTGTQPKNVIVRGIGPSMTVPGALADPILELHGSNGFATITNDNWRTGGQETEIIATTVPPSNDLESAIVATLPANSSAYTAIVRGVNNGTGVGLVEAYDLDGTVDSKLANISTRGLVQTEDNVLIGGFIIVGQNSLRVIIRAIGPSLTVVGPLGDPTLELRDNGGGLIASNNDWRTGGQEAEIIATTIPPSNDLESAIVRDLQPGTYTAIVRGVNNATGVGLVEVFDLN
jgi:plastocyanin